MEEEKKKQGRPKIDRTPEEIKAMQEDKKRRNLEYQKSTGYAAQKKYRNAHPPKTYSPRVTFPLENKPVLDELLAQTGMTINELFLSAVEEKYNVILQSKNKKGGL